MAEPSNSNYHFRLALTAEEVELCLSLRQAVFVGEQKIPKEAEYDAKDDQAFHIACFPTTKETSSIIATGRVLILPSHHDNPSGVDTTTTTTTTTSSSSNPHMQAVLGRIAVRADYRGNGIGRQVVQELEQIARAEGAIRASLTPHYYLERFYTSLGYTKSSGNNEFIHVNQYCQLIAMEKSLL